jgi:hypothetical protein
VGVLHAVAARGADVTDRVIVSESELARAEAAAATGLRPRTGTREARRRHHDGLERLCALEFTPDGSIFAGISATTRPNCGRAGYGATGAIPISVDEAHLGLRATAVELNPAFARAVVDSARGDIVTSDYRIFCSMPTDAGRAAYRALQYLRALGEHRPTVAAFAGMTGVSAKVLTPSYLQRLFGTAWSRLVAHDYLHASPRVYRDDTGVNRLLIPFMLQPKSVLEFPPRVDELLTIAKRMGARVNVLVRVMQAGMRVSDAEMRLRMVLEQLVRGARQGKANGGAKTSPGAYICWVLKLPDAQFGRVVADWDGLNGEQLTMDVFKQVARMFDEVRYRRQRYLEGLPHAAEDSEYPPLPCDD